MTTYPKATDYLCPDCASPVVEDEWTRTTADHNGEPEESSGVGHYCTNASCPHKTEPIDDYLL